MHRNPSSTIASKCDTLVLKQSKFQEWETLSLKELLKSSSNNPANLLLLMRFLLESRLIRLPLILQHPSRELSRNISLKKETLLMSAPISTFWTQTQRQEVQVVHQHQRLQHLKQRHHLPHHHQRQHPKLLHHHLQHQRRLQRQHQEVDPLSKLRRRHLLGLLASVWKHACQ